MSTVQQLGIQPVGVANVGGATGSAQQPTYAARFVFPSIGSPPIDFGLLLGLNLAGVHQTAALGLLVALIGRELLQHFILIYNGPAAMFSLAI